MTTQTTTTISTIVDRIQAQEAFNSTTKKDIKAIVVAAIDELASAIAADEVVRVHNLGTFKLADTAARTGRNPQTGEPLEIPASKRISFKATQALKDAAKA